jgi:cell division protein FtsW
MNEPRRGRPDFLLLFLTFLLVGFGLLMVFSTSEAKSLGNFHSLWYFTERQAIWAALGTFSMFLCMNIPYNQFKKWFLPIFLIVLALLCLVLMFGTKVNGHRSWFGVGSLGIQPTEFAKLSLILYLAALISKKGERIREFKKGLLPLLVIVFLVASLIMLQPDIGSDLVILLSAFIVILASGANILQLAAVVLCAVPIGAYIMVAKSYRLQRFTAYLHPWNDSQDSSYQLIQSLYAFGHGGITGTGFGRGVEKMFYLPEAHTDFIFSTIGEEFGLIGCILFFLVYLAFLWRGIVISLRSPDTFGTLAGIGIVSVIGVQALINLGGVTGSIPITGVPLPFISYGGSSLLICMTSIGILLSISREGRNPNVDRHPSHF